MREVELSQGLVALVDAADYDRVVSVGRWFTSHSGGSTYARRHVGTVDGKTRQQSLHTFLTGWRYVDHINGDGLDNRRANLRPATVAQNNMNRGFQRNSTTGFKGVNFYRRTGRWRASLGINGVTRHLGYFDSPEAAALAYDAAALAHYGEFAWLNFPKGIAA